MVDNNFYLDAFYVLICSAGNFERQMYYAALGGKGFNFGCRLYVHTVDHCPELNLY